MTYRNELSVQILLDALIQGIFESGCSFVVDGSLASEVGNYVDHDSTDIYSPEGLASTCYGEVPNHQLLDFGCGQGAYRDFLEKIGFYWRGCNYLEGMAEPERVQVADWIDVYNGITLPYDDESFGVVFSFQVFEHCEHISEVFSEIQRVLVPAGRLIGSVSYLEQAHDFSFYNLTPIGLKRLAESVGLRVCRLYPSYDVFTWLLRRLLVSTSGSDDNSLTSSLLRTNQIHQKFLDYGRRQGQSIRDINLMRLMFSSQITFEIEKPLV